MRLRKDLREGRVADLAVECDNVAARRTERCQRVAVRLAGGDLFADVVARQLELAARDLVCTSRDRLGDVDLDVANAAELLDRLVRIVKRLAVPARLVFDRLDALAL